MAKGTKGKPEEEVAGTDVVAPDSEGRSAASYDYGDEDGAGFEGMTQDELLIPFLNLIQKGSRVADEEHTEYIEGAKAGFIMNSVSEALVDGKEGILFIPVHRENNWIEWIPRDKGGGFVARHEPGSDIVAKAKEDFDFGAWETPDGNDLVDTRYIFGLIVDEDGGYQPAMIAFSKTQLKPYQKWMSQARGIQGRDPRTGRRKTIPLFGHTYRLTTRGRQNESGSWHIWNAKLSEPADRANGVGAAEASRLAPDDELYLAAKELRDMVMDNKMAPAYDSVQNEGRAEGGDDDGDVF